jgi:hypothetical protein
MREMNANLLRAGLLLISLVKTEVRPKSMQRVLEERTGREGTKEDVVAEVVAHRMSI